jgi:hypothetical protein
LLDLDAADRPWHLVRGSAAGEPSNSFLPGTVPLPVPWQLTYREGEAQFGGVSQLPVVLFARKHGLGLALKVHVRVTADVDGDSLDGAAGEVVR